MRPCPSPHRPFPARRLPGRLSHLQLLLPRRPRPRLQPRQLRHRLQRPPRCRPRPRPPPRRNRRL
ncbi:MAG: hypothetical protein EXR58_01960 [Chloroflexi bacterium]|nr:hypothetical protein [Chloroflexota bacterium]